MNELTFIITKDSLSEKSTIKYLKEVIDTNVELLKYKNSRNSDFDDIYFRFIVLTKAYKLFTSKSKAALPRRVENTVEYISNLFFTNIDNYNISYEKLKVLFEYYPLTIQKNVYRDSYCFAKDLKILCLTVKDKTLNIDYETFLINIPRTPVLDTDMFKTKNATRRSSTANYNKWLYLEKLKIHIKANKNNTIIDILQNMLNIDKSTIDHTQEIEYTQQALKNLKTKIRTK